MEDGGDKQIGLEPYVTVAELERVWRRLDGSEEARADALLAQAPNYLRQIALNNQLDLDQKITDDPTGIFNESVKMVVLSAVQRVMSMPAEMPSDATQWTQSATPYSESIGFSNGVTTNNLFFKARELQLLGLGSVSGKTQVGLLRGVR